MKKALSLILAVMMLLGCMSITALAEESNGTWSYDPNTNTFTVNCTIPKKETLNTAIPEEVSITPTDEITGITGLFALWGKTCEENGYLYGSRNWMPAINRDDPDAVFKANTEYGYIIGVAYDPSVLQKDLSAAKIVLNGKKYSEIGVAVAYDSQNKYAEAFIVVDFGTLNADGSFTGGDFAGTESGNKSGNTDITLTVAKPLTYDMVIPEDVTNLNAAGVFEVGQAKATNVKNATDKTVISYTAETTAFKCEGKTDIPASYYTDEAGQNAFPTTAVEVYKNKADAASIPTMYVGISETDWNAAENGTYKATVTFNFEAEEVVTIADILPEEFPGSSSGSWWRGAVACALYATGGNLCAKGDYTVSVPVTTVLAPASGDYDYTCTVDGITWKFAMSGDEFCKVNISGAQGDRWEVNGDYSEVD